MAPDSESTSSRLEVFGNLERTNTSCDYCGTLGVVKTHRCKIAENLEVPLICTDCE